MTTKRSLLAAASLVLLASGCTGMREKLHPRSLANTPCDGRIMGALLGSEDTLTRQEIAYLQRCGVRFASAE
jgi:hypothetical protein